MRRRAFIRLLSGAAVAQPFLASAHQPEQMRRIGVLMNTRVNEAEGQTRVTAFVQGLEKLGWTDGRNVRINIRWAGDDAGLLRQSHRNIRTFVELTNAAAFE